jgi:beta-catenin-like protein 1
VQGTSTTSWLINRIQIRESPLTQNKQYAAELLAILLQSSPANRKHLAKLDGVDVLLQLVSPYRKRDPMKGTEEEEFFENIFDCLTCVVDEEEGKRKFMEAEGIELCLIMLREGKMSKPRALRLLDHAVSGLDGAELCGKLVEAAGLKTIFGMFMKKQEGQTTEHLLGIFAALLRLLPPNSDWRIRALAKFVEKDYEKIEKLIKLRRDYALRLKVIEEGIEKEKVGMDAEDKEEMAAEWFSRRLDGGLFCLQITDLILAWLVAEDGGAQKKVEEILADRDEELSLIKATLKGL